MTDLSFGKHRIQYQPGGTWDLSERSTTEKGNEKWIILGYYSHLEEALASLFDRRVGKSAASTVEAVMAAIAEAKRDIMEGLAA